ncbi:MAG: hypothetical protein WD512_05055 [Candidatus Paceibacterota bacterium]
MELIKVSKIYEFRAPLAEPHVNYQGNKYFIERVESKGKVVWYGIQKNWVKEPNESAWKEVFGKEVKECEEPIYEKLIRGLEAKLRLN